MTSSTAPSRLKAISLRFREYFGGAPRWAAAAPGRVNFIGEHTDYNDGFVLPMAIERWTVVAAAPASNDRGEFRVRSETLDEAATFTLDVDQPWTGPKWVNYIRGVFIECARIGMTTPALDVMIQSDVPLGGGLSSSAALEVAAATLIEAITATPMTTLDKAKLCRKAEHEHAQMPCGIMDQAIVASARAGELLLLDCRSMTSRNIPMHDPSVSVLVIDSCVKHQLADGMYARRRSECEEAAAIMGVATLRDADETMLEREADRLGDTLLARARHVVTENKRTLAAAAAIEAGDWRSVGARMYESHVSLRDDYQVSCAELDLLVELAGDIGEVGGVYGARMTGGGFGGSTVNLVQSERVQAVARAVCEGYEKHCGVTPAAFVTRPAAGAMQLAV